VACDVTLTAGDGCLQGPQGAGRGPEGDWSEQRRLVLPLRGDWPGHADLLRGQLRRWLILRQPFPGEHRSESSSSSSSVFSGRRVLLAGVNHSPQHMDYTPLCFCVESYAEIQPCIESNTEVLYNTEMQP